MTEGRVNYRDRLRREHTFSRSLPSHGDNLHRQASRSVERISERMRSTGDGRYISLVQIREQRAQLRHVHAGWDHVQSGFSEHAPWLVFKGIKMWWRT